MAMINNELHKGAEQSSETNETVWAFDPPLRLERGEDRGEESNLVIQKTEVNIISEFLHKASRLIPAEFAETKSATGRRRISGAL